MIANESFTAAFPLHDGPYKSAAPNDRPLNDRNVSCSCILRIDSDNGSGTYQSTKSLHVHCNIEHDICLPGGHSNITVYTGVTKTSPKLP